MNATSNFIRYSDDMHTPNFSPLEQPRNGAANDVDHVGHLEALAVSQLDAIVRGDFSRDAAANESSRLTLAGGSVHHAGAGRAGANTPTFGALAAGIRPDLPAGICCKFRT